MVDGAKHTFRFYKNSIDQKPAQSKIHKLICMLEESPSKTLPKTLKEPGRNQV
jgi:hypothetical protein